MINILLNVLQQLILRMKLIHRVIHIEVIKIVNKYVQQMKISHHSLKVTLMVEVLLSNWLMLNLNQ